MSRMLVTWRPHRKARLLIAKPPAAGNRLRQHDGPEDRHSESALVSQITVRIPAVAIADGSAGRRIVVQIKTYHCRLAGIDVSTINHRHRCSRTVVNGESADAPRGMKSAFASREANPNQVSIAANECRLRRSRFFFAAQSVNRSAQRQ